MNQLPGEAVSVLEPSVARAEGVFVERHEDLSARRQLFRQPIDFLLCAAFDVEGDGWIELEEGPSTDCPEREACKLERHHVAVTRGRTGQGRHIVDSGAGNQSNVELGRFAGLPVEPQMRSDCLHSFRRLIRNCA